MSLVEVAAALEARDLPAALGHALAFWRGCRREQVVALIDQLSAQVTKTRTRPGGASVAAKQEAWLALAARRDPADLEHLLATLTEVRKAKLLEARLAALAGHEDPRIARAMHGFLMHPPIPGSTGIPSVELALARMIECADPRSSSALRELVAHVGEHGGGMALWGLRQRLPGAHVRLQSTLATVTTGISADDAVRLDALERSLAASATQARDPDELYAAVYANPADDGARSVLADLLQERGDPRGELIALQLARAAGGKRSKRESELLARHAREWLGRIAPVVLKTGLAYERGFITRCRVTGEGIAHAEQFVGLPEWSTVVELDVASWRLSTDELIRGMPELRTLHGLRWTSNVSSHPTISWLSIGSLDRVEALLAVELPSLRTLVIESSHRTFAELEAFWRAPLCAQLDCLQLEAWSPEEWIPALARLGLPRVGYSSRSWNPWRLWLEGAEVRAEHIWKTRSADDPERLAALLSLVPAPAERHVILEPGLAPCAELTAALARFGAVRS